MFFFNLEPWDLFDAVVCGIIHFGPIHFSFQVLRGNFGDIFQDKKILYGPGKAANAGGVAVSGLELVQNSMRLNWLAEEVDDRLKIIMKGIHQTCLDAAKEYGTPGNYFNGANIYGFVKVVDAMVDQGVI